jgi:hypothetical protein
MGVGVMIHFLCPLGHKLVVPAERAGKKGRCPVCHQKVYVPVANPKARKKHQRDGNPMHIEAATPDLHRHARGIEDFEIILEEELGLIPEIEPPSSPPLPPPVM